MSTLKSIVLKKYYNIYKNIEKVNNRIDRAFLAYEISKKYWENKRKNLRCVYTCLTGGYDNLMMHDYIDFSFDYICFTDDKNLLCLDKYGVWQIKPLICTNFSNALNNRWHKLYPHEILGKYEESIYVDSNVNILTNFLFEQVKESSSNLLVPMHFKNDCVYDEAKLILKKNKETKENISKMIDFLKSENFPKNYGLTENNIIYRKHNDSFIRKINEEWWGFVENYTQRDQMSFSYVLWKNNISIKDISIPNARRDIVNFEMKEHIK